MRPRVGRAIPNPTLPNIRLASLEAGPLRQVLRTEAFNQAAHASTAAPTRTLAPRPASRT
jgi:hypothetical protein